MAGGEKPISRRVFGGLVPCCGPMETSSRANGECCYHAQDAEVVTIDTSPATGLPRIGNPKAPVGIAAAVTLSEYGSGEEVTKMPTNSQNIVLKAEARPKTSQEASKDPSTVPKYYKDEESAKKVLEAQCRVPPANFSGSWRCDRVTGNMEAFLTDMGLEDNLRKAAATAGYGTGVQVQNIVQMGDFFEVENILRTPVTMTFLVGAGEQQTVDQVGKPILVDPRWEGQALFVASRRETGEAIADSKRYYENDHMVIQFTSPQGTVVERSFKRTPA